MLLGILGAILLGNTLRGEGAIVKRQDRRAIAKSQGQRFIRAGYGSTIKNKDF